MNNNNFVVRLYHRLFTLRKDINKLRNHTHSFKIEQYSEYVTNIETLSEITVYELLLNMWYDDRKKVM